MLNADMVYLLARINIAANGGGDDAECRGDEDDLHGCGMILLFGVVSRLCVRKYNLCLSHLRERGTSITGLRVPPR